MKTSIHPNNTIDTPPNNYPPITRLASFGVEVRTCVQVDTVGPTFLMRSDGTRLVSATIIWAAGVAAHPLTRKLEVPLDRAGRVRVNPDLSVPGYPEVFAIGDMAPVADGSGGSVPGVSPAAMQMARHVARLIGRELTRGGPGESPRPAFRYCNRGATATIGRSAAVAQVRGIELSGWSAWAAWLLVHLIFLIGFRNKATVLLQWT